MNISDELQTKNAYFLRISAENNTVTVHKKVDIAGKEELSTSKSFDSVLVVSPVLSSGSSI